MNCLKKKFKKEPAWKDDGAEQHEELSASEEQDSELPSDSDSDLEGYAGDVISNKYHLDDENLIYKQLANINGATASSGKSVSRTKLNPKFKLGLVAIQNANVDLFEIDGERNKYLNNIKVPRTRSPNASFTPDGESIILSAASYKGSFYTYNLSSQQVSKYELKVGKDCKKFDSIGINDKFMACVDPDSSEVFVLSAKTFEIVFTIKLNENAIAVRFDSANNLFILGANAHAYIWDTRQSARCKNKFTDDGCIHSTSLAISETSDLLSIGSDTGIVNTYNLKDCFNQKYPKPLRSMTNVKNMVDLLEYNHTGELLLAGSSKIDSDFRLIHSTGRVYRNFPRFGKKHGKLFDFSFSPLSGYMALGCSSGKAHLFRLPYYKAY